MSKAAELANLIGNINAGGGGVNRNLVINGAMNVSQRGDVTNASGEYTLDRYRINNTNLDELEVTVSQDTDTPSGFSKSMKVDVTTAESAIATDERCSIEQRIEAQNLQHLLYGSSDAKTCTLSFFVKSSVAGKYGINIRHHDASVNKGLDYTINSADTWERKEISFTGYTSTAIADDNGIGLWIRWMLIVGTDYQNTGVENAWNGNTSYYTTTGMQSTWGTNTSHNFYLTGVQLEVGQNPTEFEHEPFERTLKKCERYFTRINAKGSVNSYNCFPFSGFCRSSTLAQFPIHWNQPMRSVPTMSYAGASTFGVLDSSGSTNAVSNISTSRTTEIASAADWTSSGLSAGNGTRLVANNTADAFIDADAEL